MNNLNLGNVFPISSQVFSPQISPYQNQYQNQFDFWNKLNFNNQSDSPEQQLNQQQQVKWADMDMLGKTQAVVGTGLDALKAANSAWGLFSSISQFSNQKAMNKEALKNAKMKNEALRFDIDNRKAEVARWNQIRSNVNKQMTNASAIKTSY